MDILRLRQCKKAPSAGGMSRAQVDDLARQYGLNPAQYRRKDELCDAIFAQAQQQGSTAIPAAAGSPTMVPAAASPSPRNVTNLEIAKQLRDLGERFKNEGETYRSEAMIKAARAVERFPVDITEPRVQLRGVPGIGPGTIDRIAEFLKTGGLAELAGNAVVTEKGSAIKELTTVYGVGPASAEKFFNQGIPSIADLVNAYNQGRIDLTANQIIGLTYYDDLKQRIPRAEVTEVGNYVLGINASLDRNNTGDIVGSYRRGKADSGDIDILITNSEGKNYLAQIVERLEADHFLVHKLALGEVSLHGTYRSRETGILHKIDIRYVPPESYATALLHATGSDRFNVRLRQIALGMKPQLSLSEFGLLNTQTGQRVPTAREEDVFRALGILYVPPNQREE